MNVRIIQDMFNNKKCYLKKGIKCQMILKIPPEKLLKSSWRKEAAEIQKEYLKYCEQSDEVTISNGDEIIIRQKNSK